MEFHQHKVNLSFSIENILRDDFPHRQRTNVVTLPKIQESGLDRWRNPPYYRCYTVRYSPIFMKCLPSMYKVEGKLHRVNGGKEQILPEQHEKKIDDDRLSCKDEALHQGDDEVNDKQVKKSKTCLIEKTPKRKRRNRSHFTQRQLQYLEKIFSRQQYLTRDERTLLARGLEMTELQIRNWFQNQRYQKKHRASEEKKQNEPDSPVYVKSEA